MTSWRERSKMMKEKRCPEGKCSKVKKTEEENNFFQLEKIHGCLSLSFLNVSYCLGEKQSKIQVGTSCNSRQSTSHYEHRNIPITRSARGKDNIFFCWFHLKKKQPTKKTRTRQFLERRPAFTGGTFQRFMQKLSSKPL